jgi:Holliday junction resolvase-like predicted endonuclease
VIYFVEVKYRNSDKWGSGIDYITPKKLQQMQFAAEFWMAKQKHESNYQLAALGLTGQIPDVDSWYDDI